MRQDVFGDALVAARASLSLGYQSAGSNFKDAKLFQPYSITSTGLLIHDAAASATNAGAVAFFTELANRGVIDSTNWTGGTYKTILSVSSGSGVVYAMVACTAGGAETTTFEVTVDGALQEVTVTNASGERALLVFGLGYTAATYTTAAYWSASLGTLNANKDTYTSAGGVLPHPAFLGMNGTPGLQYNKSILIRMKHSVDITNSTATAYSGVMYRAGIAS